MVGMRGMFKINKKYENLIEIMQGKEESKFKSIPHLHYSPFDCSWRTSGKMAVDCEFSTAGYSPGIYL